MTISWKPNGQLIPVGGGDNVPMSKLKFIVGRRETCDVIMNFPNVSSVHCEFVFKEGFWYVHDLNSTNGVKVNGVKVMQQLLRSRDEVTIGKRVFHIEYDMPIGSNVEDRESADIFGNTLLERAGLERGGKDRTPSKKGSKDPVENYLMDDDD